MERFTYLKYLLLFVICFLFSRDAAAQMQMTFSVEAGVPFSIDNLTASASYTIDWGDGTTTTNVSSHTYASADTVPVIITTAGELTFQGFSNNDAILSIDAWGGIVLSDANSMFLGCSNLKMAATDVPTFKVGASVGNMFRECEELETINGGSFANWNLTGVTNMSGMFRSCKKFNSPLNSWTGMGSVTNFSTIFFECSVFDQDLDNWDVSSATRLNSVFHDATNFNGNVSTWDVSNCESFSQMFRDAGLYNQPLNNWDVGNGTNFDRMFLNASAFNQPLGSWDMSSATSIGSMFQNASNFNQNINSWDVGNVLETNRTFFGAVSFNQPLDNWDVSSVVDMNSMFYKARAFNQPLNSWDVSSVTNMVYMFFATDVFNQPLDSWDVSSVTRMDGMFQDAIVFNQPLDSWDVGNVTFMNGMFYKAFAFDQPLNSWDVSSVTRMDGMFYKARVFNQPLNNWNTSNVVNMRQMFDEALDFNQNISSWDVGNVINFGYMFRSARDFNQPLNWDTGSATTTENMFEDARSFNQNIDSWDMSDVTNVSFMFSRATVFNQPLNSWDVGNVTTFRAMFNFAPVFNQPLNNWNTGNAESMSLMFREADAFNQDIGDWDVSKVITFESMFQEADIFNGDLSNWNTASLINARSMFFRAVAFNNNSLKNWNMDQVTSVYRMFREASSYNPDSLNWNTSSLTSVTEAFFQCSNCNPVIEVWDVSELTTIDNFLSLSGLTAENYDKILIAWGNQSLKSITGSASDWASPATYCKGESARANMMASWTGITDAGLDCSGVNLNTGISNQGLDLVSWFRADTGVVTSSGQVDQWLDMGLYGGNLTDVGATKFDFDSSSMNFNPVLRNPLGVNRRLVSDKVLPIRTMFIVSNPTGDDYRGILSKKGLDEGNVRVNFNGDGWSHPGNVSDFTLGDASSTIRINGASGSTFDTAHIVTLEAANLMTYENGLEVSTEYINSRHWQGDIAEIMLFADVLTPAEQNQMESYLAIKYGFTLDQSTPTNYSSSSGTIIWDASSAGIYENNIFGIGRSDSIKLHQRISRSITEPEGLLIASSANFVQSNITSIRSSIANDDSYFMLSDNGEVYSTTEISANISDDYQHRIKKVYAIQSTNFSQAVSLKFQGFDNTWILMQHSSDDMSAATKVGKLSSDGTITTSALQDGNYITLAKLKSLSPGGVMNDLGLWLRPEVGTNATTQGQDITTWDWVQPNLDTLRADGSTYPDHPVFEENGVNFNPTVHFQDLGSSGNLGLTFGNEYFFTPAAKGGMHFFIVGKPLAGNTELTNFLFDLGLYADNSINLAFSTGGIRSTEGGSITSITSVEEGVSIVELDLNYGGNKVLVQNGKVVDTRPMVWSEITAAEINEGTTSTRFSGPFIIGRQAKSFSLSNNGGRYFKGQMGDFIIYQGAVSDDDINKVQSYLAVKYGITLDQTIPKSYINSAGDTIWDASRASIYKHHIFGIGSDIDAGLDQRVAQATGEPNGLILATGTEFSKQNNGQRAPLSADKSFFMVSDNGKRLDPKLIAASNDIAYEHRLQKIYYVSRTNYEQPINMKFQGFDQSWVLIKKNTADLSKATAIGHLRADGSITTDELQDGDYFTLAKAMHNPTLVDNQAPDLEVFFNSTPYQERGDK